MALFTICVTVLVVIWLVQRANENARVQRALQDKRIEERKRQRDAEEEKRKLDEAEMARRREALASAGYIFLWSEDKVLVCGNGHRCRVVDFQYPVGTETTTTLQRHAEHIQGESYEVDFWGQKEYDSLQVHESNRDVLIPSIQSHVSWEIGCPTCHTTLYEWEGLDKSRYVECQINGEASAVPTQLVLTKEGGSRPHPLGVYVSCWGFTVLGHWYLKSFRTCPLCDPSGCTDQVPAAASNSPSTSATAFLPASGGASSACKCGGQLEASFAFCPRCGSPRPNGLS